MSSRISDAINWFEKSCFGQWMWSTDMALESTVHIENICEEKNTVLWRYENICVSSSKYTQCVFYSSWTKLLQYLRAVSIKRTIWRINILQSIVIRCSWYKPDVFLFKLCTFVRFSRSFILTRVSFFTFSVRFTVYSIATLQFASIYDVRCQWNDKHLTVSNTPRNRREQKRHFTKSVKKR